MMHFEQVPRLPAHHLHGATLQDGARLWAVARAVQIEPGRALYSIGENHNNEGLKIEL